MKNLSGWLSFFAKKNCIEVFERIQIQDALGKWHSVEAKIDTGAFRTSVDKKLAKQFGLLSTNNVVGQKLYTSALGQNVARPIINLDLKINNRTYHTEANVADRSHLRFPILIGRRDLTDFVIFYRAAKEVEGK